MKIETITELQALIKEAKYYSDSDSKIESCLKTGYPENCLRALIKSLKIAKNVNMITDNELKQFNIVEKIASGVPMDKSKIDTSSAQMDIGDYAEEHQEVITPETEEEELKQ